MSIMAGRLRLEGVRRSFGRHEAVSGVSLDVAAGEVVCLLGPSGCGKSTTLRIAAGVERQDAGRVEIQGRLMAGDGVFVPPEERGVGLMFQDFALFPHMKVAENVAFGLAGLSRAERNVRALEMLERVGMANHARKYPNTLSGGEQQRVALARALCPRPGVLLMDEPFSGLDARLRDRVRDQALSMLKEVGASALLVTHDPAEAMRMADRIALMREGRIVQIGSPHEVYNHPIDGAAAALFSDLNVFRAEVREGRAHTPLGPVPAPGHAPGTLVDVMVRPQAIRLAAAPGAGNGSTEAVVDRARLLGPESLVDVRIVSGDGAAHAIQILAPGTVLPEPGRKVGVRMPPEAAFVFPSVAKSPLN